MLTKTAEWIVPLKTSDSDFQLVMKVIYMDSDRYSDFTYETCVTKIGRKDRWRKKYK